MAERRRIIPASVGPLFQPKEEKSWEPAVRFQLTLGEPNDTKCTEFSYRALYKNAVGETSDDKKFNDLEEEDISGLAAFAKRFEEKYAAKGGNKKKQREEINDLMDCGMGYDDTDPFVDNSECYDELVPSVLTTQLGGFYINQGQLNFREISDDEDDDFIHTAKSRKKKTPHKKAINSIYSKMIVMQKKRKSSFEEKERKKKKQEKKAKKQLQKQFGLKRKKNISGSSPTVAELLKRQQLQDAASKSSSTSTSGKLVNGTSHTTNADADLLDSIDPSLDLGLADFKMDSDMAAVMEDALASLGGNDTLGGSDENEGSAFKDDEPMDEQYVKCPTNLPADMIANIEKIKGAARKSAEGKCKFFTPSVNQLLLKIEVQSHNVKCGTRSQMYSHLASHLPCGKETLLKRAKKLRLGQEGVIKEPLQKLREAIAKVMPENIQRFNEECQLHALEKANRMLTGKEEGKGSDDEEDKKSKQGNFGPRRKFQWNEQIRKLLCEVVSIKVKNLGGSLKGSQSAEDHVKSFLDMEVKPLWPQGWIQTRMLYKETRSVHGHLTSNQPIKPKKVVLSAKKVTTKKPGNEGTPTSQTPVSQSPLSQSDMSVATMIAKAMMSSNGNSNQSSPATSPPERVPTLLDYANTPLGSPVQVTAPTTLFKDAPNSKPATSITSPVYKDSTNYAASMQGNSMGGVNELTASFVEKLIADELAASDKGPSHQTTNQMNQPISQTSSQIRQPASQMVSQTRPPVSQTVSQSRQPFSQTVSQIRQPVSQTVSQIRQPVSQTVSQIRKPVSQTVGQTRPLVSQTLGQTRPLVNQTVGQIRQLVSQTVGQTRPLVSQTRPHVNQTVGQTRQLVSQSIGQNQKAGSQTKQTLIQTQPISSQMKQVSASATGQTTDQMPMSIAEIVADTAKAMLTPVPRGQASSVLKQLSTHAQNNTHDTSSQMAVKKPVVMKPGLSQDRLKKLSIPDGKRTVVNIPKQIIVTGPDQTLAQTIQKLSCNIASSSNVTKPGTSQSVTKPMVSSVVASRIATNAAIYNNTKNTSISSIQKSQPVVRLTRPPTMATSKPQVRMATSKAPAQTNITPRVATAQPVRTIMTKAAARIATEQPMQKTRAVADGQVRKLTPANVQANMGNIFANLSESLFPSPAASSKELPYYTTTTISGKNSIPKTSQLGGTHSYHQQQTSPNHPIHTSSYSPPTKATKHLPKHQSGSAFTAPSPPKQKSSTPPALSPSTSPVGQKYQLSTSPVGQKYPPSTSPVGQKYPPYVSQQRGSPQTSPTYPANFSPNIAAIPGYQQLSLADLSPNKQQATLGYTTQGYPLNANQQGQGSAAVTGTGDAVITGPAPGTFFHQHTRTGVMLSPMQSPTEPPYQLPPWAQ